MEKLKNRETQKRELPLSQPANLLDIFRDAAVMIYEFFFLLVISPFFGLYFLSSCSFFTSFFASLSLVYSVGLLLSLSPTFDWAWTVERMRRNDPFLGTHFR